jgi:hypothetical protein
MGERRRTVGSRKLEARRAAGRIVPGHPTRETRTMLKVGSDFYILLQAPSVSATRSLRTWLALEGEHAARVDGDRDTGFRVAPTSRVLALDGKGAEAR